MNLEDIDAYQTIKNGTCPHTGKPYDCARCAFVPPPHKPGVPYKIHFCLSVAGPIKSAEYDKTAWHRLSKLVELGGHKSTPSEVRKLFTALHLLGVDMLPTGGCDNFCYRHGCLGHEEKGADAK